MSIKIHSDMLKMQLESEKRYSIGSSLNGKVNFGSERSIGQEKMIQFFQDKLGLDFDSEEIDVKENFRPNAEISRRFNDLITPYSEKFNIIINEAWRSSRSKKWQDKDDSFSTWDEIKNWDRLVSCINDDCDNLIDKSRSANDQNFWESLLRDIDAFSEEYGIDLKGSVKPHPKSDERKIDFNLLRLKLLPEGIQSEGSGFFSNKELSNMREMVEKNISNDCDKLLSIYQIMQKANHCIDISSNCNLCGRDNWMNTPVYSDIGQRYFSRISEITVRSLMKSLLGSIHGRGNRSFTAKVGDFVLPEQFPLDEVLEQYSSLTDREKYKKINTGFFDKYLKGIVDYEAQRHSEELILSLQEELISLESQEGEIDIEGSEEFSFPDFSSEIEDFLSSKEANRKPFLVWAAERRIQGTVSVLPGKVGDNYFQVVKHRAAINEAFSASFLANFAEDINLKLTNETEFSFSAVDNNGSKEMSAMAMELVNSIAYELLQFKQEFFFHEEDKNSKKLKLPLLAQLEWSKRLAVQLILLMLNNGFLIKAGKINTKFLNIEENKFKHNMWVVSFLSDFRDEIMDKLTDPEGGKFTESEIVNYFDKHRIEPMLCPPIDRTGEATDGGYISYQARKRNPLIQNDTSTSIVGIRRFSPSPTAIKSLNILQQTSWRVNNKMIDVVENLLSDRVNQFLSKCRLVLRDDNFVIDYTGKFPEFSKSQILEWIESINLAKEYSRNDRTFWHAWSFDWRGRLYPCSNLLTPQADDISRGLIEFAEGQALDENGLKWIERTICKFFRKREINGLAGLTGSEEDTQIWNEIQILLEDKKWEGMDKVFQNPRMVSLIHRVCRVVGENPIGTRQFWAEGDIFRKKGEGFQRLSTILAYNKILKEFEQGNPHPEVHLPIILDGSSNIYQHASVLTQDLGLARSVNVSPQIGLGPQDVYQKVSDIVRHNWDQKNPFINMNLSKQQLQTLEQLTLNRNIAKKPVMTLGYGSKRETIPSSLLSHNGDRGGIIGGLYFDKNSSLQYSKEDQLNLSQERFKLEKKEFSKNYPNAVWKRIPHPNAILGELNEFIDLRHHQEIATIVADGFFKAYEIELKGHSILKRSLEAIQKIFIQLGRPVSWSLNDSTTIQNIALSSMKNINPDAWNKKSGAKKSKYSSSRFTIKMQTDERDIDKEARGLSPNFVHSIDALHMRNFVINMDEFAPGCSLWSVHDAFGCHPNFAEKMNQVIIKTFFEAHQVDGYYSVLEYLISLTIEACKDIKLGEETTKELEFLEKQKAEFQSKGEQVSMKLFENIDLNEIYLVS